MLRAHHITYGQLLWQALLNFDKTQEVTHRLYSIICAILLYTHLFFFGFVIQHLQHVYFTFS